MTSITIEAVYKNGVFRPLQPVSLPDDTRVEIKVPAVVPDQPTEMKLGPLAGAFPGLAALADNDLEWARDQWELGLEKQLKLLAEDDNGS